MTTRQQRRARARAPARRKRRGGAVFVAAMIAVLLAGGAGAYLFRSNPKPLTRGAIVGEHWHARYRIEICGKTLSPFPFLENEVHSHGDGVMHVHPATQTYAGPNANLRAFMQTYETSVGQTETGERFIVLPDGSRYEDGKACPGSSKTYDVELLNKGKAVSGDPGAFLPHEGDDVILRFGPKATETTANPLVPAQPPTSPAAATPNPSATVAPSATPAD